MRTIRKKYKLTKIQLAELFAYEGRQIITVIEIGQRRMTAQELTTAIKRFDVPIEYFTALFHLIGKGRFSWRREANLDDGSLAACERRVRSWVVAFRDLAPLVGRNLPLTRRTLCVDKRSRLQDAMLAGDRFAGEFELGDIPATKLTDVMAHELNVLVHWLT